MKTILTFLFFSSWLLMSHAQTPTFEIKAITEERRLDIFASGNSIELEFEVKDVEINKTHLIKLNTIGKAIDSNNELLEKKRVSFGYTYQSKNEIRIALEAPLRSAESIKEISGTINYFTPSEENGSKIIVHNPLEHFNSNLLKSINTDVKLLLVDKAALDELEKKDKAAYMDKLKALKLDQFAEGLEKTASGLQSLFEDLFKEFEPSSKDEFIFYVEDKSGKLVDILIHNDKGEPMQNGRTLIGEYKQKISLREIPQKDWTITILLENEASIKVLDFIIFNIQLP